MTTRQASEATDDIALSFRSVAPDLLRYFMRRTEIREDAADAVGDVFLTAWSKRRSAPVPEHERRLWLFGVARNVLLNRHRTSRRARAFAEQLRSHVQAQDSLTDFTDEHADAALVRDAIGSLDPTSAELVRLVHWDGFSLTDAATVLAMNPSTARGRYQAAKTSLRDRLRTDGARAL